MKYRLAELNEMHPLLVWDCHIPAAIAVFQERGFQLPYRMRITWVDIPGFGNDEVEVQLDVAGVSHDMVARVRRTFDMPALVEMAAIAVAGITLFHAGLRLLDMAVHPSRADYIVGDEHSLLEVAGRSDKANFNSAWDARWRRLTELHGGNFYLSVTEFETPASRLAYATKEQGR